MSHPRIDKENRGVAALVDDAGTTWMPMTVACQCTRRVGRRMAVMVGTGGSVAAGWTSVVRTRYARVVHTQTTASGSDQSAGGYHSRN
jgi:hypothetical protein